MPFNPPTDRELEHRFGYHKPPNEITGQRHDDVRRICLDAAKKIRDITPCCPEQTRAINALDDAMMLANAAIARNPPV